MIISHKENINEKFSTFHYLDLGHLFERILRSWEAQKIQHLNPPAGPISDLPLERMVTLTGALNGLLVVRSTRDFAVRLRSQRGNSPLGRYPEEEVFEELISLFCLYLFHDFWRPHLFKVGPIHPFRSLPCDWPKEEPTSSSGLMVDGYPVEIRLWLND
jgi:hypothetical protein